ncbi:hypothetical protein JTB14_037400 [Gonioctena quinquepunctata]|nr:hypothetical protein JTB14_037400 [Gonioctena quinquepunctata]
MNTYQIVTHYYYVVPENDAEACLTALKYENLSAEEFDSHWEAFAKYRLNDIKIMPISAKVFQKWSFYKKPYGYRLVDSNYEIAFGNGELLSNNWEKSFPNIVAYLQKDGHIKDRAAKALLEKSVEDSCDENGKYANSLSSPKVSAFTWRALVHVAVYAETTLGSAVLREVYSMFLYS